MVPLEPVARLAAHARERPPAQRLRRIVVSWRELSRMQARLSDVKTTGSANEYSVLASVARWQTIIDVRPRCRALFPIEAKAR